jgi:hypothetical protein
MVRNIAQQTGLTFTYQGVLEAQRSCYSTTTLVARRFRDIEPEDTGLIRPSSFAVILLLRPAIIGRSPLLAKKMVFRRKGAKSPHITTGRCLSPLGDGPPPLLIYRNKTRLPNLAFYDRWGKCELHIRRLAG